MISRAEKKNEQYLFTSNGSSNDRDINNENIDGNQKSYRFVLQTLIEGFKRSLESISKRIDSFIYYTKTT